MAAKSELEKLLRAKISKKQSEYDDLDAREEALLIDIREHQQKLAEIVVMKEAIRLGIEGDKAILATAGRGRGRKAEKAEA